MLWGRKSVFATASAPRREARKIRASPSKGLRRRPCARVSEAREADRDLWSVAGRSLPVGAGGWAHSPVCFGKDAASSTLDKRIQPKRPELEGPPDRLGTDS